MIDQSLKEQFIAKIKSGSKFQVRSCSMCNYTLHFFAIEDALYFDAGCDCTNRGEVIPREWRDLDFYLDPEHGHIPKIEAFVSLSSSSTR